ncbi:MULTISPECIES: ATP-grasp domain-containing protein [unclassified Mesotoga]|jgi:D-alanine-D-alanine ligase|uniref:D-alanine--D-alanine ligase family protein n=1 Tax=unclassified Mesotoga TaxID=1184398 RepID=UPI000CCC4301|nr:MULTISPECIES: ATP-grasp domain-containing protein [unclassified Mesotoga]PNS42679.1 D-alanine--D-alanine ligase [Mesotoga sp. B105.6.4]
MRITVVHDTTIDFHHEEMVRSVVSSLENSFEVDSRPFEIDAVSVLRGTDLVFNLTTAMGNTERQIHLPAVLDLLGVPFTGSGATANALCINKTLTKLIMKAYGISTPEFFSVRPGDIVDNLPFSPAIVKPVKEGGAKGIWEDSVVVSVDEMQKAVSRIHERFGQPALVERFIEGREFTVGIVGIEVLPIMEIDFSSLPDHLETFYSYRVKQFHGDETNYICPAKISQREESVVSEFSLKVFGALDLKDYCRIDLKVDDEGKIHFLEVNSLPLLVPDYSDIVKMAEARGWSYGDLINRIVASAISRYGIGE